MDNLSNVNIAALRAVEAVARLRSLSAAADALGVTPGAVSQQVIKAEAQLDQKLFVRTPKGMVPSPIGEELAGYLTEGFSSLDRGVALLRNGRENVITISVAPVFAAKWLVRRLGEFTAEHPSIRVQIEASSTMVDPRPGTVDACIRVGTGEWGNVHAEEILAQRVFPVCAPSIAASLRDLNDLQHVPIIKERANGLFGWDTWLGPNDMSSDQLSDGPVFSDAALCLDAAIAGQGVFLGLEVLSADAIAYGQLVAPFPGRFSTGVSYWFVEADQGRRRPEVEAFRTWLIGALRKEPKVAKM